MEGLFALLYNRVARGVSKMDMARISIALGGDAGGGGGKRVRRGGERGGKNLFFTAAPAPTSANGVDGVKYDKNGAVDDGFQRRRASIIPSFF